MLASLQVSSSLPDCQGVHAGHSGLPGRALERAQRQNRGVRWSSSPKQHGCCVHSVCTGASGAVRRTTGCQGLVGRVGAAVQECIALHRIPGVRGVTVALKEGYGGLQK